MSKAQRAKLFLAGMLVLLLGTTFWLRKAQSNPLDLPTGTVKDTFGLTPVVLTTASFQSTAYFWCVSHLVVTSPTAPGIFTMYSSTSSLTSGTTVYSSGFSTSPYLDSWSYREPICVAANTLLTLQSSVAGSTITYQAYSFKGWNP